MKKIISNNKNAFLCILALLLVGGITMAFEDSPFMRLKFPDTPLNTDTLPQVPPTNNQGEGKPKCNGNYCNKLSELVMNNVYLELKKVDFNRISNEVAQSLKNINQDKLSQEIRSSILDIDWKAINKSINEALQEVRMELQKEEIRVKSLKERKEI